MIETEICDCCGEAPSVENIYGENWCERCAESYNPICESCERMFADKDDELFGERFLCQQCATYQRYLQWLDETVEKIEAVAEAHGWEVDLDAVAETGSHYYLVSRSYREADQTDEDYEDYGPSGVEEFSLRLSDHGDVYCSADYSVAMDPSGDDVLLATVLERLQRPLPNS